MEKSVEVKRKRGHSSDVDAVCCFPGLFKPATKGFIPIDVNDPFIASPEILLQECNFTADETEVSQEIKEILNLSDARWKKATEIQTEFEKRLREKEQAELEKEEQKKAAEQRIKKSLDLKVDMIFKKHSFFVKKQCPVLIPYKSSLNHAEHEAYLRAFVKFKIRKPKTGCEAAEYERYLRLQNRVFEEQRLFMDFSFQVSRLQLESYNAVPQTIKDYVHDYVQHRCNRAVQYNSMYFHEQQVPIRPQDPTNRLSNLHFQHLGHLLSLGSVPWVRLPNNHKLNKLSLDDSVLESQPPVPKEKEDSDSFLPRASVSEDPNAVYLAQKHLANIVISRSALRVIADNPGPNFDKEWDIPMRVKNFEIEDVSGGKRNHRVVFIDKPMPKKVWTPLEKKQLFYKKCALASLLEIKRMKSFRMRTPPIFRTGLANNSELEMKSQVDYNEDFFDLTSTASHDVFGVDAAEDAAGMEDSPSRKRKSEVKAEVRASAKRSKAGKKKSKNNQSSRKSETKDHSDSQKSSVTSWDQSDARTDESDHLEGSSSQEPTNDMKAGAVPTEDRNSFLDDLIDLQDCLLKPQNISDSPEKSKDTLGNTDPKQAFPWAKTLQTDWIDHKQAKNCELWTGRNKHYQLYSMGLSTSNPSTCSSQDLRIIIRHNVHGVSQFKNKQTQSKAYVVHPKIEHQPFFGCEVNTLSEITQQWVSLVSAPNASLLQVRICESSGEVMMAEEKNLEELLKDGKQPHIGFTPQQYLVTLYSVFTAASGLPAGDFLLHHDAKTAFVQLLRAGDVDKSGSLQAFNFHSAYACTSPTLKPYTVPPWLAIDTHLLTPFHVKHQKIPATFPMDNPKKKLTKVQKQLKLERSKSKKKLADLDKEKDESEEDGCSQD